MNPTHSPPPGVYGTRGGGGPRLTMTPPGKVVFSSGAGAVLSCVAEGSPPPVVTWVTREGRTVPPHPPYTDILANGSLIIRPFMASRYHADVHTATVRCRATNTHGSVLSTPITLQPVVWQDYSVSAEGGQSTVGGSALLRCVLPAHLTTHLTPTAWETNTHTIYPSLIPEGRFQMSGLTGSLMVQGVTREDSMTAFTCRVRDTLGGGRDLSSRIPAKILLQDSGELTRPVIQAKRVSVTVEEGGSVVLPCVATGNPIPDVRWSSFTRVGLGVRLGGGGPQQTPHKAALGSAVLVIDPVRYTDAHTFTCTANNSMGSDQMIVEVIVERLLTVSVIPRTQTADLGGTATFTCNPSDPQAEVSWYYNGVAVLGSGRVAARGQQLIVSGVTHDDPGMYQCQAARGERAAQQAAQLSIGDSKPVLQYRFIEQSISPGTPISLRCSAVGNPPPSLTWSLDGLPIHPHTDRVVVGVGVGSRGGQVVGQVNITHTRVQDGGRYRCAASNRVGVVAHEANLNIYGLPVARPLAAVMAVAGEKLDLRCPVAGYPLHSFTWIKDGSPVSSGPARRLAPDGTLRVDRVRKRKDAGVYTCTATTKLGRSATGSARVTVLVPPSIEPLLFQEGLSEGMRTRLICGVSGGDSPLKLSWYKDGQPLSQVRLPSSQVKVLDLFSSVLVIGSLTAEHSGRYTCQAQNAAAAVRSSALITVQVPPSWVVEPGAARVSRGHSLVVDCVASGHPQPSIRWQKLVHDTLTGVYRGVELVSPRSSQLTNGSLYIAQAQPQHSGTYVCHAKNTVADISATVNITVNSAPYFRGGSSTVDVRAGEVTVLECRVRGDPPLTVSWSLRGSSVHHSPRYSESMSSEPGGKTIARLSLSSAVQSDAGLYTCTAHNTYGRNSHAITLNVHEPPSAPVGLRVIGNGSKAVVISWGAPYPPPASYIVQYRRSLEGWGEAREVSAPAAGVSAGLEISPLLPATDYIVRIVAVNHLGRSPPSEDLRLTTSEEKPGAPPRDLRVEASGAREVRVSWRPPTPDQAHGDILGFYLGYVALAHQVGLPGSTPYNFTTVERSEDGHGSGGEGGEGLWTTLLRDLQPYTQYQIVVQAFNTKGSGPLSQPATVTTREDAPSGTPQEVRCSGLTWESVQVTWSPPASRLHHGIIRGYSLEYEEWDGWSAGGVRASQTRTVTAILTGLHAATNYSVRVRAYTAAGDGPWAIPVLCTTEEDVPGRPVGVRGVVSGSGSFIVSWSPPARPGGRVLSYTVTWRVLDSIRESGRGRTGVSTVSGTVTWVQVDNVHGSLVEVDVVAATRVGSGPPGAARVTLTNTFPAAIYSSSTSVRAEQGRDVTLPCGHVGQPRPKLSWTYQGRQLDGSGRLVKGDGGLVVQEATREHSGNYTCSVTNKHGSDHITYSLTVLVPPSAPLVLASSSSERSVQVQWKQGDKGGSPITGFVLYYRKDHGSWSQLSVHRHAHSHTLQDLECGSRYHVYVVAHNSVGSSPASTTAVVRTLGGVPQPPPPLQFLTPNTSSVTVFPRAWVPRGCPITHMVMEYKRHDGPQWVQVSSGDPQARRVEIVSLGAATRYFLRVTAVCSAGSTTHTYPFTTLTMGGEVPPPWVSGSSPQWVSVRVLLPLLSSVVALVSSLALVCYCVRKKTALSEDGETSGVTNTTATRDDKKHNLARREQYYVSIRKSRDQQSVIPESASDIYPYATFPLRDSSTYHSRTDESMDEYGEVKRRGSRSCSHHHSHNRSRGGPGDSSEDYQTLGTDSETVYGGVSTITESSNQLDDIPSIQDHSVYGRGPGKKESGDYSVYGRGPSNKDPSDYAVYARIPNKKDPSDHTVYAKGPSKKDSEDPTVYGRGPANKDPGDAIYSRDTSKYPTEPGSSRDSTKGPVEAVYSREMQAAGEPMYARDPQKDPREAATVTREGSRESTMGGAGYQHNLLYHAESRTSPEPPSPTSERKSFPRHARARSRVMAEVRVGEEPPDKEAKEGSSPPHTSHHPPPSYPGDEPPSTAPTGTTTNDDPITKSPRTTNDPITKSPRILSNTSMTTPRSTTTSKEPSEVNTAEGDQAILPRTRSYSDAKAKGRILDYSIAV